MQKIRLRLLDTLCNNILTRGYRSRNARLNSNCTGGQIFLLGLSVFLKYEESSETSKIIVIKKTTFKDEKLNIRRNRETFLDRLKIDGFVRWFIEFK